MDQVVSTPLASLEAAEELVAHLREKGIPARSIAVEDRAPAHGLNLGAGVTPDAINAVIEQQEDSPSEGGYVVTVETGGDALNEAVALEVFGFVA